MPRPSKVVIGGRYGKLVVLGLDHIQKERFYRCQCDCGGEGVVRGVSLVRGTTKSCGCEKNNGNRLRHGMSGTKLHGVWWTMLCRCQKQYSQKYQDYGARGI